jgi:release factor glutamine methyltransferase
LSAPLARRVAELVGSAREAAWILDELAGREGEDLEVAAMAIAERRAAGEPLQYLLGSWPFRTIDLMVTPAALIPRPETEVLVEQALARLRAGGGGAETIRCLDLGTGTGAIGLSLAVELAGHAAVELHLSDCSSEALALASSNAAALGIDATLHEGSWYAALPASLLGSFDLIVSNPPYVPVELRGHLDSVLDHEPATALYAERSVGGCPGFAAVEEVITGSSAWLAPCGILAVEMGEDQVDEACALARRCGLIDVAGFLDLAGRGRGILAAAP